MPSRDAKDIIGGILIAALGAFFFIGAYSYGIGTVSRMGGGYFPRAIGALAVVIGLALLVNGLRRSGSIEAIPWRPVIAVSLSVAVFALLIRPFGLVPATFATTVICSVADRNAQVLRTAILGIVVSIGIWLIFIIGLGISAPAFRALI